MLDYIIIENVSKTESLNTNNPDRASAWLHRYKNVSKTDLSNTNSQTDSFALENVSNTGSLHEINPD